MQYTQHQRDYTLLGSSEVIEGVFQDACIVDYFGFRPHPIYLFIKDNIFSHHFVEDDFTQWPLRWLEKYDKDEAYAFAKRADSLHEEYSKFTSELVGVDTIDALIKLHKFMREFTPVVFLSAFIFNLDNHISNDILKQFKYLRDKYEDIHKIQMTLEEELIDRLELELNVNNLRYLTADEFREFVKDNTRLPTNLNDRKKFFLIKYESGGLKKYTKPSSEADKIINLISPNIDSFSIADKIEGVSACKGFAKGAVKVIYNLEDINKINRGDILAASMTDPRYLSAMKKVSAIITDEGGVTCHAAIVSRELDIPCIIATKIATKVLKDGDAVEVNANEGIVTILNRA